MNLINLTNKVDVIGELKKGNTEVLKGMPPVLAMQYGLALQNEVGQVEESHIDNEALSKAMLERMQNGEVKDRLVKQIEDKEKAHAERVALARQITREVTGE